MAIKTIALPSTGIYQRTIKSVALPTNNLQALKDLRDELEQSPSQNTSLPSLDDIQGQAERFLRQYLVEDFGGFKRIPESDLRDFQSAGIDYVVMRRVERAREDLDTRFQETLSQEERRELINNTRRVERASDACDMLHYLSVIRCQMKYGSPEVAASHGVWLGIAYERFRVRASEPKAWTGGQTLDAARKGGAARKKNLKQYEECVAKFQASGLSQRAYARTAQISVSTLKRALKKLGSDPAK